MAELDLTYYHGSDLYSDGDENENKLLEIVRAGKSLDEMTLEEVSWPILYHLHPVRENVCNWYPFQSGSRILEIGAGCGAVTGALCRSGNEVYAVDLSQRRSMINYERHKQYDKLHIMVGNLNEMSFPDLFDYVLLVGVLEYAGKYTGGEKAYRDFLVNIGKYMKPDGKLLIAIENRLGLKYFAGAKEDHLGEPFTGLNGYPDEPGVRTFSRSELEDLLLESGYPNTRFFYPYPDYKFPLEIFSDDGIQTIRYGKAYYPVDEPRCNLFSEPEIAQTLSREGVAGRFANSFFVEATTKESAEKQDVLYVKLNADRNQQFQIGTMIRNTNGQIEVLKYPMNDAAKKQIQNIQKNEEKINQTGNALQGQKTREGMIYPFITDPTAEQLLCDELKAQNADGILHLLDRVYQFIAVQPEKGEYESEPFRQWFGEEKMKSDLVLCIHPANIDMILDNIFIHDDTYQVMDCEWVADFPVPLAFVMWRTLVSAIFHHPDLTRLIARRELMTRYHIAEEDEKIYSAWSEWFEIRYVGNNRLSRFSKGIRIVPFDQQKTEYMQARIAQLEDTEKTLQQNAEVLYRKEAELRQQLFDREKEAGEMKWQIEYREKEAEWMKHQIEYREKEAEEMRRQIEHRDARIAQLEITERELRDVYQSRTWATACKIRGIWNRVVPPGSYRRKMLFAIKKGKAKNNHQQEENKT